MFNLTLKRVSPAVVSMIVFFEVPVAALVALIFNIGKQPDSLNYSGSNFDSYRMHLGSTSYSS
jgi:hypothetical protein